MIEHDKREDWVAQLDAPLPGEAKPATGKATPTTAELQADAAAWRAAAGGQGKM